MISEGRVVEPEGRINGHPGEGRRCGAGERGKDPRRKMAELRGKMSATTAKMVGVVAKRSKP